MREQIVIYEDEDEIDLIDLLLVLWRRKWISIGVVLISMLSLFVFIHFQGKKLRTELTVSLGFNGIEKGLYPDGTNFKAQDIASPKILNAAGIDSNIWSFIHVEGVIPKPITAKIKKNSEFIYYPNLFKIVLIEKEENLFFESNLKRKEALSGIVKEFRKNFEKKFIQKPFLLIKYPQNFIQSHEYMDIISIFDEQIQMFENLLTEKNMVFGQIEDSAQSLAEILSDLKVLRKIDFENVKARISALSLVKNKEAVVAKIMQDIKLLEYDRLKNEKKAETVLDLLKFLKSGWTSTGNAQKDETGSLVMDNTFLEKMKENDYLFYLIKNSIDANDSAITDQVEIQRLKDRLEGIEQKKISHQSLSEDIVGELTLVEKKIVEISQRVNELSQENSKFELGKSIKTNNIVTFNETYGFNLKLILVLVLVSSILFGIFLSFIVEYIVRYKKNMQIDGQKKMSE